MVTYTHGGMHGLGVFTCQFVLGSHLSTVRHTLHDPKTMKVILSNALAIEEAIAHTVRIHALLLMLNLVKYMYVLSYVLTTQILVFRQ